MKMVRPPLHAPAVTGVLDRLYRRRVTIMVTVAACLALGFVADVLLPQRYTSSATVTVAPLTDTPYGNAQPTQLVNMESERATVTSLAVSELASRSLEPRPAPAELQEALGVVIPAQSLVLRISATNGDPTRSADWANAVATAYLTDRTNTAREAATRIASRLQSDVDARVRSRRTLTAPEKALVDREIAALRERQAQLSVVGLVPGRLVTPATRAESPSTMGTRGLLVGAVAVGLLLGVLLALLQDRRDARIRSAAWIEETLGIPVRRAAGAALDRQARLVLGLLLGGGQVPARLVLVSTHDVPGRFAQRLTALARDQGVSVLHEVHPSLAPTDAPVAPSSPARVQVAEWIAAPGQPWPIPPSIPSAMFAVDLAPGDLRRDLIDLVDSVRYLGSEVDFAVLSDDALLRDDALQTRGSP